MIVKHREDGDGVDISLAPGEAYELVCQLSAVRGSTYLESHEALAGLDPLNELQHDLTEHVRDYVLGSV